MADLLDPFADATQSEPANLIDPFEEPETDDPFAEGLLGTHGLYAVCGCLDCTVNRSLLHFRNLIFYLFVVAVPAPGPALEDPFAFATTTAPPAPTLDPFDTSPGDDLDPFAEVVKTGQPLSQSKDPFQTSPNDHDPFAAFEASPDEDRDPFAEVTKTGKPLAASNSGNACLILSKKSHFHASNGINNRVRRFIRPGRGRRFAILCGPGRYEK